VAKQIKHRAAEGLRILLKDPEKWVHFQFEKPTQKPQAQIAVGGSVQWEKLNLNMPKDWSGTTESLN